jgi:cytochrome c5
MFCFSCHAAGIAGAPKAGDVEAWAPRVAKGQALLLKSTVEGMPSGMPPMGLCAQCTEEQLSAAIDLMTLAR